MASTSGRCIQIWYANTCGPRARQVRPRSSDSVRSQRASVPTMRVGVNRQVHLPRASTVMSTATSKRSQRAVILFPTATADVSDLRALSSRCSPELHPDSGRSTAATSHPEKRIRMPVDHCDPSVRGDHCHRRRHLSHPMRTATGQRAGSAR